MIICRGMFITKKEKIMKKRKVIALSAIALLLVGCASDTKVTSEKVEDAERKVSDVNVVSAEEFNAAYPNAVILPEGLENVEYTLNTSDNPISEVSFSADGVDYVLKVKQTEDIGEDLAGVSDLKKLDSDMVDYVGDYLGGGYGLFIDTIRYEDGDTTVDVSPWSYYVDGVQYCYALVVKGKDLDGFDITAMAARFHDRYFENINEQANNIHLNSEEFPDGEYFSDVTMINGMSVDGGMLVVDCDRVYPRNLDVPGAIYGARQEPFLYKLTLTGEVDNIQCVKKTITGADEDGKYIFEESSCPLNNITGLTFGEDEPSPTELVFELQGGKIVGITEY